MKLGLIGCSDHWRSYSSALSVIPDLEIAAVATAAPHESLATFDGARGVTDQTRRYDTPEALLEDTNHLDAIQVSTRADLLGHWTRQSLEHGLPTITEKPFAFDLDDLAHLHEVAQRTKVPVCAMHGQRATPLVAAVQEVVRRGAIGTPLVAHNQKSYKWGNSRPEAYKDRHTFPGVAAWIGIHVFDWLLWILGDRFEEVTATGSSSAHPDYPACASHSAYLFKLGREGMATTTVDYLRPEAASSHGDERIRIAGTIGVVEISTGYQTGTLIDANGITTLDTKPPVPWYARFFLAATGRDPGGPLLHQQWEIFRATEIALKAQLALDRGRPVSLKDSPYHP
jgi:predicted dehydrogenase